MIVPFRATGYPFTPNWLASYPQLCTPFRATGTPFTANWVPISRTSGTTLAVRASVKNLLLFALLTLCSLTSRAQPTDGRPPLWLFGNRAGLDFSAPGPPLLLEGSSMNTVEGSAVACDPATGRLLFYTDGQRVWGADHRPMPNGRGLYGSQNSAQSALVVRRPGQDSLWYVFTTDFQGGNQGLRYSVVSTARRGGLGDVIEKNTLVFAPVAEKLTAVRHANGRDVWVVAHRWQSTDYLSVLVTADGVQSPPVFSSAGTALVGPGRQAIGYLRASPDGRHLAAALWRDANKFEVLDFDPATGAVFGRVTLAPYNRAYGVEFSADGSKLYGTCQDTATNRGVVWQFDLRPGPDSAPDGQYNNVVGHSAAKELGALLRGPDGRLYVARHGGRKLAVISTPNAAGEACGYVDDGVELGKGSSRLGLPNGW